MKRKTRGKSYRMVRGQGHILQADADVAGDGAGRKAEDTGMWGGSGRTHLATTNAHATVVELEFVQCEAGGTLEQGLEASHAVGPEGVVTQVQLHQLGPGRDESLPERDLGTEELVSVS